MGSADAGEARAFVKAELGRLLGDDDHSIRLSATLRVYLEENMRPSRASRRLGVHEHTTSNRIKAARRNASRVQSSSADVSYRSRCD